MPPRARISQTHHPMASTSTESEFREPKSGSRGAYAVGYLVLWLDSKNVIIFNESCCIFKKNEDHLKGLSFSATVETKYLPINSQNDLTLVSNGFQWHLIWRQNYSLENCTKVICHQQILDFLTWSLTKLRMLRDFENNKKSFQNLPICILFSLFLAKLNFLNAFSHRCPWEYLKINLLLYKWQKVKRQFPLPEK